MSFTEDTEPRLTKFMDVSESWDYVDIGDDLVTFVYSLNAEHHDKHMMDSLMWEIHQSLTEADYPPELGIDITVSLHLGRDHSGFEDTPAAKEPQGGADED